MANVFHGFMIYRLNRKSNEQIYTQIKKYGADILLLWKKCNPSELHWEKKYKVNHLHLVSTHENKVQRSGRTDI